MAEKTVADVIIGGKVYTLSGYEDEAYLQKVASYINNKMNELDAVEAFRRFPIDMKSVLIHLNIADDYFKAKAYLEKMEVEAENKDKELYDLKHDLIACQIKAESGESALKELEAENKELMLEVARLEAALEDAKAQKVEKTTTFTSKKK
ncbi:MAG: cell division protein ZapA [Roseburia sp.]|nr:cell division protein ZapA [Roseburia sp.]